MQEQLDLRESASAWWDAHRVRLRAAADPQPARVALVERPERLVLFVDEIDTTLRLDFTDDFFAAIRFLYQNRALDAELERISFVLIGVATPNDLIKDAARTPFNIGRRIELTDFTTEEAAVLLPISPCHPECGGAFIDAILRWTNGHPYLTMRALRSLAETPPTGWASAVDERVRELFLGPGGEADTNLQFVRDMLTKAFNREAVLAAYEPSQRRERSRQGTGSGCLVAEAVGDCAPEGRPAARPQRHLRASVRPAMGASAPQAARQLASQADPGGSRCWS